MSPDERLRTIEERDEAEIPRSLIWQGDDGTQAAMDRRWLLNELKRKVVLQNRYDEKWNDLRRCVAEFEDMFPNRVYPVWLQVLRKKVGPR